MATNFENFLISPDFPINFRKSHRIISKALRVMDKNLWGVPKDPPGLNRVNHIRVKLFYRLALLFDMGFFEPSVLGVGGPHHNFVVLVSMSMNIGIVMKLDAFYTMVGKNL